MLTNEKLNDLMTQARIRQSLFEIEKMCKDKPNGNFSINCPAIVYSEINKHVRGKAQGVRQEFPVSSLASIVDMFKTKLLSFFIDLDKKLEAGVDFLNLDKEEITQIMKTYNINSVVTNLGDGVVNTGNIVGNNITQYVTDPCQQEKFKEILSEIENIVDLENNMATIETIQDDQTLTSAVEKAGYKVVGIKNV